MAACENRPLVYVEGAPWKPYALDRLGILSERRTFGPGIPIEQWFSILKQRIQRFTKRWPHNADPEKVNDWLRSFVACHHLRTGLS